MDKQQIRKTVSAVVDALADVNLLDGYWDDDDFEWLVNQVAKELDEDRDLEYDMSRMEKRQPVVSKHHREPRDGRNDE